MIARLAIRRIDPRVRMPVQATPQSVGLDVHAFLLSESGRPNNLMIPPKTTRAIPTGLIVWPAEGYAVYVCSRSGLAKNLSLFVTNAPGVVDPDYRGEIQVLLYNGSHESQYIQHDDRVAQLVLLATGLPQIEEYEDMPLNTERGDKGFGSSGR